MDINYFSETELAAMKALLARVGYDPEAIEDICDTNELDIVEGRDGKPYAIFWDDDTVYAMDVEDEEFIDDQYEIRRLIL